MLAAMEHTSRPSMHPAGAGMLLASVTVACIGVCGLIGWLAGGIGYGLLIGAIIGIPAGVLAVYLRYRDSF
jgi:F0F1-type ATP synthase assembly protein I